MEPNRPAVPGPDPHRPDQRLIASHARWRVAALILAIVAPLALYGLFERQVRRLEALSDHGETTLATVEATSSPYVTYRYSVDGESYTWSVLQSDAPYGIGETFSVIYLPEDPALTRPTADRSKPRAEAESNRRLTSKYLAGAFAFFLVIAGLSEIQLRKLRERPREISTNGGVLDSPVLVGRVLASLVLLLLISTNFDSGVSEVQRKAFGEVPLGVPVRWFVSAVEILLVTPYFWVFPQLVLILTRTRRGGPSGSAFSPVLSALLDAGRNPELRRARAICLAGLIYFVILAGSWIAFAESRGL